MKAWRKMSQNSSPSRARAPQPPQQAAAPTPLSEPQGDPTGELASLAGYIAEMTGELSALAGRAQLPMLAYFLNLARVEAEMRSREFGVRSVTRKS
jgi:hypothetical protein